MVGTELIDSSFLMDIISFLELLFGYLLWGRSRSVMTNCKNDRLLAKMETPEKNQGRESFRNILD
jgi:hypothetical protein